MPNKRPPSESRQNKENAQDLLETHRYVGVPYTVEQITQASADFKVQKYPDEDYDEMLERYPGATVPNFDGQPELFKRDALIAYPQVLATSGLIRSST